MSEAKFSNEWLREQVDRFRGLYVGQLTPDELEILRLAVERGIARRSYEGGGGLMGLAKVRLTCEAWGR